MEYKKKVHRCCFAGHRKCYDAEVQPRLMQAIEKLVIENEHIEFWIGNYGQFDDLAASAVRKLKLKYPSITLSLIIPYLTKEINEYRDIYYQGYDSIIMADIPISTPINLKIIKTNQFIVDHCDYIICYVNNGWGGAVKTLKYAKKKKLPISNLGSLSV